MQIIVLLGVEGVFICIQCRAENVVHRILVKMVIHYSCAYFVHVPWTLEL